MPSQLIDARTQIKNLPYLDSRVYDWDEVNGSGASGDLSSPGAGKVITFLEAPQGIAVGCYVKISGGTGTEEVALITAETCSLSGYGAGTITVTTANAHTGAWQVGTATAGIQEALSVLPATGGTVLVAAGTHTTFATIRVRGGAIVLRGEGRNTSTIYSAYKGGPLVYFDGANSPGGYGDCNEVCDLTIRGDSAGGSNYALEVNEQSFSHVNRISICYTPGGIKCTGDSNFTGTRFHQINIVGITDDGIHINALPAGGNFDDILIGGDSTSGSNGIHIVQGEGQRFSNVYTISCGNGFLADPGDGQTVWWTEMVDCYFDVSYSNGFAVNPSGTGSVVGLKCTQVTSATTMGASGPGTGCGFIFGGGGTIAGVTMNSALSIINTGPGFYIAGGEDLSFNCCVAVVNSGQAPGTYDGMDIVGGDSIIVNGGTYAACWGQSDTQLTGIAVGAAATNVQIVGAKVTPNLIAGITNGSSTTEIINCKGYNPVGPSAISPGASPYTYTAGASPETVYIYGGTVSAVVRGGVTVAVASPATVHLQPRQSVVVTYSAAPTMAKDVQ